MYERKANSVGVHIYMDGARIATLTNDDLQYYYSDHLGGTNLVVNDAGAVVDVVEYEPFGEFSRHDAAGRGEEGRFYTNQYRDNESGLYYYGGRYYNPKLARFISADPFIAEPSDPQSFNRFSYVGNNPINFIDPSGFALESIDLGIIRVSRNTVNDYELDNFVAYSDPASNYAYVNLNANFDQFVFNSMFSWGAVSNILDLTSVSALKSGVEFASGRDYITGNSVNRGWAFVGVVGSIIPGGKGILKSISKSDNIYAGVKKASNFLKAAGISREKRIEILRSFDIRTIKFQKAGNNQFGIRYFGNNAREKGRFLFVTFLASRNSLALRQEFNSMEGFCQFKIRPGTDMIVGRTASQGIGYEGGQMQIFIVEYLNDLLELK